MFLNPPDEEQMESLHSLFPNADDLLALSPDDLAPILLRLGAARRHGGIFEPHSVPQITVGSGMMTENQHAYPPLKQREIDKLLSETWELLRRDGMLIPAPGINGVHGFLMLSRDGEAAIASPEGFERIKAARAFPKSLLHPSIAKSVGSALGRGDYDSAVREAFTMVEVNVRQAGGYADTDIGTDLMRKAFNAETGKLNDASLPEAEREGYAHLFAGAVAAFKNPHSHRKPGPGFLQKF
jgi:uncharacterized protein (TIGR02391 family)